MTRDAEGSPIAAATIVARNLDENTDRSALSGADGAFEVTGLAPGRYELTAHKDGAGIAPAINFRLAARQSLATDIRLSGDTVMTGRPFRSSVWPYRGRPAIGNPSLQARLMAPTDNATTSAPETTASSTAGAEPVSAMAQELAALKQRIEQLEAELHARTAPAEPRAEPTTPAPDGGAPPAAAAPAAAPAPQQAAAPTTPTAPVVPEALQAPDSAPGVDNFTPFAFGDFTWLNGTPRNKDTVLDTKFFTPEVRFDTHFMVDFNQPRDHTMGGATESYRSGEIQEEQISVGGDFHWQNVRGRVLYMMGLFGTTTPRNDASAGVGQWDLRNAYRYVSEAYGGYHFNVNHGLNVDAGIFVSYIGLFSYYNFDNWTYQPSFVSSNTPWFFNGLRIQWFPTKKLKIEPWIINGWQSYARFNGHRGLGGQILYRPHEWLSLVFNNYGNGTDTLGNPGRSRIHTDDSIEVRYYNQPESTGISKMAFSATADAGCEYGGGVTCHGGKGGPKQSFLGWMLYNRIWWNKDKYALTLGGGMMNNQGRYLTLLPPINGADAISGSPYFTANPGDKAHMWDATATFHWMPRQYITWWLEAGYRHSDIPYWSGRGGITPPGGNTGSPAQYVCAAGGSAGTNDLATAYANCGGPGSVWFPDLRRGQATLSMGVLVKF